MSKAQIGEIYHIAGNFRGKYFRKFQAIRENIIQECLVYVDKDRAIALIRKNIIREMLYLVHSRKFSPSKISNFTVLHLLWETAMFMGYMYNNTQKLSSK